MKIGLIGFGRLGQLLCKYLSQDFHVLAYDTQPKDDAMRQKGAEPASLEAVCACPIVIPLVPISAIEGLMQQIAPLLQKGALVADVCSVKVKPVESMVKHLPEHVSILGTHPMFGPDSAADTLFGAKLVLCPVRIPQKQYANLVVYLEKHGIKVVESTPEEHDKQMSRSLFLTQMIGRTLMEIDAQPLEIDTKGYRRLMKILLTVQNDSFQLFEDMYHYNPFSSEAHQEFVNALDALMDRI